MNSKKLVEIQAIVQNSICDHNLATALFDLIIEKPPASIQERMKIYQDAYIIRLSQSLSDDFKITREKMGSEIFENLVQRFIKYHPSTSRNLAEYSDAFPHFIENHAPLFFETTVKEWMEILSFQAADPENTISLEDAQDGTLFLLCCHPASVILKNKADYLLAYRFNEQVFFQNLSPGEQQLFDFLKIEKSLEQLESFSIDHQLDETLLFELITDWVKKGIIICIKPAQDA